MLYSEYILSADVDIVREVQFICAGIAASGARWDAKDGATIAAILNRSDNPGALFRFIDEKTGSSYVGYRTQDGREWFHILRQMRNTPGSGLLENLNTWR